MAACWSQILSCYSTNAVVFCAGTKHIRLRMGCLRVKISGKDQTTCEIEVCTGGEWRAVVTCSPWGGSMHREVSVAHQDRGDGGGCQCLPPNFIHVFYFASLPCSLFHTLQSVGNMTSLVPRVLVPALWNCWSSLSLLAPRGASRGTKSIQCLKMNGGNTLQW